MVRKPSAREPRQKPGAALADKLARLGIARDADLVLHLPLRYEDHTRLVPLGSLQAAAEQQVEGTVVTADIQYRPRRQLVCLLEDAADRAGDRAKGISVARWSIRKSPSLSLAPRCPTG